jgi:hypothetical protein
MAQQSTTQVDTQVASLIEKKLTLMEQIHSIRAQIRQADREMMKIGSDRPDVQRVVRCW